jgi:hypothetical protein
MLQLVKQEREFLTVVLKKPGHPAQSLQVEACHDAWRVILGGLPVFMSLGDLEIVCAANDDGEPGIGIAFVVGVHQQTGDFCSVAPSEQHLAAALLDAFLMEVV